MNRPKTIDGTPVSTSTKKRTDLGEPAAPAVLDEPHRDADADRDRDREASATISIVPRIALLIAADARVLEERVAGRVGREEARAPRAEALVQQVVDDQHERDSASTCRRGSSRARVRSLRRRAGLTPKRAEQLGWRGLRAHAPAAISAASDAGAGAGVARRPDAVPRAARTTSTRAIPLTSSVSTNSTSPAANSAERCRPWASPNSLAIDGREAVALAEQVVAEFGRVADQDRHRDRLADRAAEAEHRAADDARAAVGQDGDADHLPARRAEAERRLLVVGGHGGHHLAADRADDRQDHDREHQAGDEVVGDRHERRRR